MRRMRPAFVLLAFYPLNVAIPAVNADEPVTHYDGAQSGTLECTGGPIPQNAEYVFRNMPPVKLRLEYNKKIWDGKLVPGAGQTQTLILKNIANGPQKKCVVHWTVIP